MSRLPPAARQAVSPDRIQVNLPRRSVLSARIAYLLNQYPMISHTFIRREILALERRGLEVRRIAIRGWDSEILDAVDEQERARTTYVLKSGLLPLLAALLTTMVTSPRRFLSALALAIRMSWRADRPLPPPRLFGSVPCAGMVEVLGIQHVHAHFGTNALSCAGARLGRTTVQLHGSWTDGI